MQVTAVIQNNTLIIPNVDLSQLAPYADNHGMIEFDQSLLEMLIKLKVAKNPAKKRQIHSRVGRWACSQNNGGGNG